MNQKEKSTGDPGPAAEPGSPAPPLTDERSELVNRIAASSVFRKSPRLRQFLLFVAERTLAGCIDEITEYEIGWRVFERSQNYNPADDSIVRTAARQLRAKVKEYFDTEGKHENWTLEIPKGGYVPIFAMREEETPPPLKVPEHPVVEPPSPVRRWKILSGTLALIAIAALIVVLRLEWMLRATSVTRGPSIVSTVLTQGQQPTRIVLGDFGLALMSAATMHDYSVEEYANGGDGLAIPSGAGGVPLRALWPMFTSGQIVSLPDMTVAGSIIRVSAEEKKNVVIEHARQISARDLRAGNFIMLSAPIASPWIRLFEDRLNFRYRMWFEKDPAKRILSEFENLHPQPGEKHLYSAAASAPGFGVTYGLVARVPNLAGTGKVLLICGLKYTGFEAAGDYATDPESAASLARLLNVSDIRKAPDFEVLLETYSIAAAPRYIKVAAFRRISD